MENTYNYEFKSISEYKLLTASFVREGTGLNITGHPTSAQAKAPLLSITFTKRVFNSGSGVVNSRSYIIGEIGLNLLSFISL